MSTRAGGCEWLGDGIRVQYARCWSCICGQCPGGGHPWADAEDIEHAKATGQPDPMDQKCGCVCADGPEIEQPEPGWGEVTFSDTTPCPVCGEMGACAYDAEGLPMIHAFNEGDDQ